MNQSINKQEALQRLANLEKEAQALRKIIEKPEVVSILKKEVEGYSIYGNGGFMSFNAGANVSTVGGLPVNGNNHFSTFEEAQNWAQAIDTLIALRRQEGSCKPIDGEKQYVISVNGDMKFWIDMWKVCSYKISYISPCFISEEYALQAVANIGEEKIMHMFKTFHGITE